MSPVSVTDLYCPDSGGQPGEPNTTHHLVPTGGPDRRVQRCGYCGVPEDFLRRDAQRLDNA